MSIYSVFIQYNQEGQNVGESLQKVMVEDSLISSHPVYQPVTDPADIGSLFDSITYDKVMTPLYYKVLLHCI